MAASCGSGLLVAPGYAAPAPSPSFRRGLSTGTGRPSQPGQGAFAGQVLSAPGAAAITLSAAIRRRCQRSSRSRLFAATKLRPIPQAAPAQAAPKWRNRHWFPVASTMELDPKRPTPVRIDGLDLVIWKAPGSEDMERGWQVMVDTCAHRLAPLSEGRLEPKTGCLQCAYHGWEFDQTGACTKIPQVEESAAEKMRENPRSKVRSFPTKVALKLVWVWLGEKEPKGEPEELIQGTHLAEMEIMGSYTRDLPYGYDSLIENLIDVSHVPFAHHGLQGTRDDAIPVSMTIPETQASTEIGDLLNFTFWDRTMGMKREAKFSLRSPFFFFYLGEFLNKPKGENSEEYQKFSARRGSDAEDGVRRFRLNVACIPIGPGWSRMILFDASAPGQGGGIRRMLPTWLVHLISNRFLDSDLAFLHYQERKLRQAPYSSEDWSNSYYMPGEADRSISSWRQWLAKEGALCVDPKNALPPSPLSREELLNRWDQHSKSCVHCREAFESLAVWQRGLGLSFVAALAAAQTSLLPTLPCLGVEVLSVGGLALIETLKQEFHFKDYEHYKT